LWVVEMRGFMPDIDGEGERQGIGRVSVLEDVDGDGAMDNATVYLDSLIMPRALAIVGNGALVVAEEMLWMTRDHDGDLRADSRTLVDSAYTGGSTYPEHAANALLRGIDNWYYNAKSRVRYRLRNGEWERDSTEFRGQWGMSHDDAGRLFYNYNWSQLHADLVPPNYLGRNRNHTPVTGIDHGLTTDRRVYPIRPTPAVNRGYIPGTLDEAQKLKEFTAACSPLVYRGTALPSEYYGNVFVCEPSGNLIKRNLIERSGIHLAARDAHPGREFMASTDERFRPVHLTSGPDGALYVVDMYRGLIQHKAYVTPYLREQTLARGLVYPIHRGRIWRVAPANSKPGKSVKLSSLSSVQLVGYLSHSDGWYRDMAQRLLVERKDEGAVQALKEVALRGDGPLGRLHALWTLEGMGFLEAATCLHLIKDSHAVVSSAAVRLLEHFAADNREIRATLGDELLKLWTEVPIEQVLQIALSANSLDEKVSQEILQGIATKYDTSALIRDAVMSSIGNRELQFMQGLLSQPAWREASPAREIFLETLASSIVRKQEPSELRHLLSLLDVESYAFGWREQAIINGMSIQGYSGKLKPLRLASKPRILSRQELNISHATLEGLAALFEWPGSAGRATTANSVVAFTEREKQQFALGRKLYLNACSGCHGNDGKGLPRFGPPLKGSEWVLGDARRLSLIVLHGIEGPMEVAGRRYAEPDILPVMPGHSTLDDGTIAAILTYIRNEWGNDGGAVSGRTVGQTRLTNQGRVLPWTATELESHMQNMPPPPTP
jgi:mono/diheme cytochrome c family protein